MHLTCCGTLQVSGGPSSQKLGLNFAELVRKGVTDCELTYSARKLALLRRLLSKYYNEFWGPGFSFMLNKLSTFQQAKEALKGVQM